MGDCQLSVAKPKVRSSRTIGIIRCRLRLGVISAFECLPPVFLRQCLGVGIAHLSYGCAVDISRDRRGQETGPLSIIPEQDFSKPPCHFFGLSKM